MDKMKAEDFEGLIADLLNREANGDWGAGQVLKGLSHYSHKMVHDHDLIGRDLKAYKRHKWLQNWIYNGMAQNNMNRRMAMQDA